MPGPQRYFDCFEDIADVRREFGIDDAEIADEEVLVAVYEQPNYDGAAFVLFERDGALYEVNGSHCSCFGLEDQWQPELTTWAALAIRPATYYEFRGAGERVHELCREHGVEPGALK